VKTSFFLNSVAVTVDCHPLTPLLEILRTGFRLKGTKEGCASGECGTCLVFMDSSLVNSCLVPAFRLEDKQIMTIEGFVKTKGYADIEKAFLSGDILYCGFCTPSLVLAVESLLQKRAAPKRKEIAAYLADNLCLYAGSSRIIEAVMLAAALRRKRRDGKKLRSGTRL
jgi:aerobic-type carbon monoxide dehydrogenase small subunit (CoxS/CutS family)